MFKLKINIIFFLLLQSVSLILLAQDEQGCPDSDNKKAKKLFDKGFELFQDRKMHEAYPYFKEALGEDSSCGKCYFFLGYINFKKTDYNLKSAKFYLEKSIELCPDFDVYAYYFLGDIYAGAEDWAAAEKLLSKFVSDPEKVNSDADMIRANALLKQAKTNTKIFSNPVPFNPVVLRGVSSVTDEYIPSMSPDGNQFFYVRVIKLPPSKNDIVQKSSFIEKFCYSKMANGQYSAGEEMPYPFNENQNEGGASVTIDNNELYYTVCKDKAMYYNCDIYYTRKDAEGNWQDIASVPVINNDGTWESMPCISADGKTIYFVSDRPGGFGGYDIYYSRKDDKGNWGVPVNMGKNINTSGNEKTPFLHSDGVTFYFSSDSPSLDGLGSYDIYYSRLGNDGKWAKPTNLGYPINSDADDAGFFVSLDGKTGFFTSNKLKGVGGWDVYAFELYEAARPEQMRIIAGNVKDEENNEPIQARIEIKNVETKKVQQISVDSISGKYFAAINTSNNFIVTVKKPDYAYESKLIEATTEVPPVKEIDFEVKQIKVGSSYRLNDIYFATSQFELNSGTKAILDGFIEFLNENPHIKVAIHGHTDNVGNDDANLLLSENRSKSVYNYLVEHNIDASRLSYKGFGETQPIATNDTEAGRAKNRRTEFVILEK